jgi:enoyl-CoA hydratase/carnithine racemase
MNQPLVYEVVDGVGLLRVNRPEARNALNWAAQELFAQTVVAAASDQTLRALIITGTGSTFVAGGDLKELAAEGGPAAGERLNRVMSSALARLRELPVPVIAAINGDAVGGGCEIITACDLRLAVASARLHFVQVRLGLTTGWGGAGRLVRLIGQSRALEILLTGRTVSAQEAYDIGLLHRLVPPHEDLVALASAWAAELSALPASALAAMKHLVYAATEGDLQATAARERDLFLRLWEQPDHLEAVTAFLEKRPPEFNL